MAAGYDGELCKRKQVYRNFGEIKGGRVGILQTVTSRSQTVRPKCAVTLHCHSTVTFHSNSSDEAWDLTLDLLQGSCDGLVDVC